MTPPRYRGRAIERRGWTVVVVEHLATGELLRVYRRRAGGRWRFYGKNDAFVTDRALSAAAKRYLDTHAAASDERVVALSLYPTSGRRAVAVPQAVAAPVAQTTAAPT